MKNYRLILCLFALPFFGFSQESDSTGLEGDHLDLNGVLELFQESESVEDFEKKLNTESNGVNNLDLNEDGEVDYIRVVDHADSTSHGLALQVPVSEEESQDVALIAMEETEEETVNLQVIGDSDLYGEEYMIEPKDENNEKAVVNVYHWRPIRHIYGPRYVVWVSPYRWRKYPRWYRPWRRVGWGIYYPRVRRYHRPYYRRVRVRRCNHIHVHYHTHHHVHSNWYYKKNQTKIVKVKTTKSANGKVHTVKKASPAKTTKSAKVSAASPAAQQKTGNTVKSTSPAKTTQKKAVQKSSAKPQTSAKKKQANHSKNNGTQPKGKSTAVKKSTKPAAKKTASPAKKSGAQKRSVNPSKRPGSVKKKSPSRSASKSKKSGGRAKTSRRR